MIVTEEEAKTKWCPHFRQMSGHEEYGCDNRPLEFHQPDPDKGSVPTGRLHPDGCCMGARCMAWVWANPANKTGTCGYITHVQVPVQIQLPPQPAQNNRVILPKV